MYTIEITNISPNVVTIQDPHPLETKLLTRLDPSEVDTLLTLTSQYERLLPQLDHYVTEGLITYTALDGPASLIKNDSDDVTGLSVADALDWLKWYSDSGAGGTGDMTKAIYDTNADGIVDKAEALDDGAGNTVTALAVATHIADVLGNPHVISLSTIGAAAAVHTHVSTGITDFDDAVRDNAYVTANTDHRLDTVTNPHAITAGMVSAIPTTEKGVPGGVSTLDGTGRIPSGQMSLTPEFQYVDYLDISAPPQVAGRSWWDGTTEYIWTDITGVSFQNIGELPRRIYNDTGVLITAGTPVSRVDIVTGVSGPVSSVVPTDPTNPVHAANYVGLAVTDVVHGAETYSKLIGLVFNTDTSAWGVNDAVYVAVGTPGTLTRVEPSAPATIITVGTVVFSHATEGIIGCNTSISHDIQSKQDVSTGLDWGGKITANADPTLFDIAAGGATVIDAYTVASRPTVVRVAWDAQIGVSVDNIATQNLTSVIVTHDGVGNAAFEQFATVPDMENSRDKVNLGSLIHTNRTTISAVSASAKNLNWDVALRGWDFARSLGGTIKWEGLQLVPNDGNLQFNRTEGHMFGMGSNHFVSIKDPNNITVTAADPVTFIYGTVTTVLGVGSVVPVTQYDLDGAGTPVAIPDGYYVIHRIYYDPSSNTTALSLGQHAYDSMKKAAGSVEFEDYIIPPSLKRVPQLGAIIVKKGATNLSDIFDCRFANFGRLGALTHSHINDYERFGEPVELLNALSYQRHDIVIVESGGNLYAEVEAIGTGDMTYVFNQHEYTLDCTTGTGVGGRARVQLTPGSSSSDPQVNYVYADKNSDVAHLQVSTTKPTGEYANVGYVYVPDATTFLAEGPYAFQRYTEAKSHGGRSILSILQEALRVRGAMWFSGTLPTGTIDAVPTPDLVKITIGSGVVYQVRPQDVPALDSSTDGIYVSNSTAGALSNFTKLLNLASCIQLADGTSIAKSQRFNLVVWGAANKDTGDCKLYVNLATGVYATDAAAYADTSNSADVGVPQEFRGVAFLIARIPLYYTDNNAEVWSFCNSGADPAIIDLRGNPAGVSGSAAGGAASVFSDAIFQWYNGIDSTKIVGVDLSGITTGTTWTMTFPNHDVTVSKAQYLYDVGIDPTVPTAGQILTFNNTSGLWEAADYTGGGGVHATTHSAGAADPVDVVNLASAEIDVALVLQPSGLGGVVWGEAGGSAALGETWTFDSATTDSDPGSKKFRFNNATQASSTFVYLNYFSDSGVDTRNVILALNQGDRLYIQDNGDSSKFHMCVLTADPADATTYAKLPITVEDSGSDLTNNKKSGFILFYTSGTQNHAIGGPNHTESTLEEFNTLISDGDLDFTSDTRDPNAHAFDGAAHTFTSVDISTSQASAGDWRVDPHSIRWFDYSNCDWRGEMAFSAYDGQGEGYNQSSLIHVGVSTADATQTVLVPRTGEVLGLDTDTAYKVVVDILGKKQGTLDLASWTAVCVVHNGGFITGSKTITLDSTNDTGGSATPANWDIDVDVSATNLQVLVTGEAAEDINWGATVRTLKIHGV